MKRESDSHAAALAPLPRFQRATNTCAPCPQDEIPPYWIWFHYISHFKYSQFGLMKNYFDNMENTNFGCPPPNEGDPNCSLTGQQVLEFYDVTSWNKWYSVGALLGLGVLWRILHCVALIIRYKEYKKKVL